MQCCSVNVMAWYCVADMAEHLTSNQNIGDFNFIVIFVSLWHFLMVSILDYKLVI